ncbi:hypothetical protein ACIHFC_36945 [Streptomyces sp. NPDC052013]|uniref:hypothetical protein n=1 Tax=Streptomyces sp. NPDC052013 TaxID=3365679 RepID=UPI0037CE843F
MRIPNRAILVPAVAAAAAAVLAGPGVAHAQTVCPGGICITADPTSATKTVKVTGTAGNDTIRFTIVPAVDNNHSATIGVNGFNTRVAIFVGAIITVDGVSGSDNINLAGLNTVPLKPGQPAPRAYAKATVRTGTGNSTISLANSGSNEINAGPGKNLLLARNGRADIINGSGNNTAQVDKIETKITDVTKFLP